jgi:mercuric ion binding protein
MTTNNRNFRSMKNALLIIAISALASACGNEVAVGGETTEKFTVYGNCGMCEKTIETSLADVKGVISADWDKEDDQMTVVFEADVISSDDIKQKIADVGYDTDSHRAKSEVYDELPGCCQYDRPE